jgi:hypothetical protein
MRNGEPMSDPHANTLRYVAKIPSPQIGYVNAIVESYEGVAIMRTRDPKAGIVEFWVMPDFVGEFERMIEGLRDEMLVEFMEQDPGDYGSLLAESFSQRRGAEDAEKSREI